MSRFSFFSAKVLSPLFALVFTALASAYGQSTLTLTSTNPLDGPSTWGTYCYANGNLSANYCTSSSIEPYFNKSNIIFTFGGQAGTYPYAGGTYLTWVHSGGVTGNVSAANVYFLGGALADVFGISIYHEAGSTVNFTLTAYNSGGGIISSSSTSVDTDRATNVSVSSMSNVYRFEIIPSSSINFGINQLEIAEPGTFPVELMDLSATTADNDVHLSWKTAWELNNDYFAIERSSDGENFTEISRISGAGTSEKVNEYTFADLNAPQGSLLYRLRQVDFDGQFKYSSKLEVSISDNSTMGYFNPTDRSITLLANPEWETSLLTLQGQEVMRFAKDQKKAYVPEIASGLYILNFRSQTQGTVAQKIMIK